MVAEVAPKFVAAVVDIVTQLVNVVIQVAPKIGEAFGALLAVALKAIHDHAPDIIQAGIQLLLDLIKGLTNNVGQLVAATVGLIGAFLRAIAGKVGDIIKSGLSILLAIIKGIIGGIGFVVVTVATIIARFVSAIASNLGKIATAGLSILTRLLTAIANNLGKVITAGANLIIAFVTGIGRAGERIVTAARQAAGKFITTLANQMVKLADQVFNAMITLINGLADVVEARAPELRGAAVHLGVAIIQGMTSGLTGAAGDLFAKAKGIADKALSIIKAPWKALSPSRTMMELGKNIVDGMAVGLDKNASNAYASAEAMSNGTIKTFNDIFETASPSKVMQRIGQFVGEGFVNGLKGSADDIRNAFATMKQRLKDDITSTREEIGAEQDRLAELLEKKQDKLNEINEKKWKKTSEKAKAIAEVQKEYAKSIKESEDAIKSSEATLKKLTVSQKTLNKSLQDEKADLIKLADEFDKVSERLKEAQQELERLIKEREDYAKSQKEKYGAPPEISEPLVEEIKTAREKIAVEQKKLDDLLGAGTQDLEKIAAARASLAEAEGSLDTITEGKILTAAGTQVDVVATYLQDLKNQATAVSAYNATLEQLRKLGIDEKTYKMLVEEGTAAQGFAEALLSGGKTAVRSLNTLDADLNKESEKLGLNAASYLFDAGVKAQEGIVDGLTKDKNKLIKAMNSLAVVMVKALKKALGIKSPSTLFAEIGTWSMEGMAQGFKNGSKIVTDAVDNAAKDALSAMKQSMSDISSAVTNELNPQPVITPILDLTQVRAQGEELAALTTVTPITAAASYGQASLISASQTAAQAEESVGAPVGPSVKFEQNNYSPEALSDIEIYRQTKNQLSQLKSVLAIT